MRPDYRDIASDHNHGLGVVHRPLLDHLNRVDDVDHVRILIPRQKHGGERMILGNAKVNRPELGPVLR